MRVGFTGSHSTGKTSVARLVAEQNPFWAFVPSTARKVADAGLGVNREADHMSQVLTTLSRFVDESRAHEEGWGFTVSDRTPLDSLAYTKYQIDNVWIGNELNSFYWDYSKKFVIEAMKVYDRVFYFPVGSFALTLDGLRENDEKYRSDIDAIIKELIVELAIPVSIVPDGSVEERTRFVLEKCEDASVYV
jgi:predicted ATPase